MPEIDHFAGAMDLVFLIYGAAFIALALAIVVRHNERSSLHLSKPLWLLAGFGLTHGLLEWSDLWRVIHGQRVWLSQVQAVLLFVSYVSLFEFGRRLVRIESSYDTGARLAVSRCRIFCHPLVYLPVLAFIGAGTMLSDAPTTTWGILCRYLLGFPGSVLAGLGLIGAAHPAILPGLPVQEGRKLINAGRVGGMAFIAYGVLGGLIVPSADWFPASVLNQQIFREVFGFPVQLLRAGAAVVIALGIVQLLEVFQMESLSRQEAARMRVEAALQELRSVHRSQALILASSGEGIVGFDAEGAVTFANPTATVALGFEATELLGRSLHALTHHSRPDGSPYPEADCPISKSLRDQQPHRVDDEFFWRRDGTGFPVDFMVTPMFDGAACVGGVLSFRDTTQKSRLARRRASTQEILLQLAALPAVNEGDLEAMVRVVTERLAQGFEIGRVSVWLLDESDQAVANPQLRCVDLFTRVDRQHTDGCVIDAATFAPYLATLREHRYALAEDAHYSTCAGTLLKSDAGPVDLTAVLVCLIASGSRPFGVLCLADEGCARNWAPDEIDFACQLADQIGLVVLNRERRRAEAASRAKSAFIASMSHELRTPMNAIIGMNGLALRRATDPTLIDQLSKVGKAAQHLLGVINNILDLSKIEADRLTMEQIEFRLGEILENLSSLIGNRVVEKGLRLQIEVSPALANCPLKGDPLRLTQILLNLVGNAVKFSSSGSVVLRVAPTEESDDGVLLHFEVEDHGIGIAPDDAARLFMAFEQAGTGTARKYGGTGLGLAISKRLARQMGGEIGVVSELGRGSTFWFTARLLLGSGVRSSDGTPAASAEARLLAEHAGTRVLLVEDEPVNQEVSVCLLEDAGLSVDVADTGEAAVEMARESPYALILMDMQLPGISGVEATHQIRADSLNRTTPILAMTANAFIEDRRACIEAGMNDHITKPVDSEVLFESVLKWLSKEAAPATPA